MNDEGLAMYRSARAGAWRPNVLTLRGQAAGDWSVAEISSYNPGGGAGLSQSVAL